MMYVETMTKTRAKKASNMKRFEGMCVGMVGGKVVVSDKDIGKVIKTMREKYPNMADMPDAVITSVPKSTLALVV